MSLFKKIFLTILIILILIILFYSTYFYTNPNNFLKPIFQETKLWWYDIIIEKDEFKVSDLTEKEGLKIDFLTPFSSIISYPKANFEKKWTEINLKEWTYFIENWIIDNKYKINSSWFEIIPEFSWNYYIDISNPEKNIIISLNNILKINLKNPETEKIINTIFLYPHQYIILNPTENENNLKSAVDVKKIRQWLESFYYLSNKFLENNKLNISDRLFNRDLNKKNLYKNILLYKKWKLEKQTEILNKFKKANFTEIAWENFIEKYLVLFLNPEKKRIYYKNKITKNIWNLIQENNLSKENINNLYENFQKLKKLNLDDYNEMKKILYYYWNIVLKSNLYKTDLSFNFAKIIHKFENSKTKIIDANFIELRNNFLKYDFVENYKKDFYKSLDYFVNIYNLNIEKDKDKKQYYIYFLENIIWSSFADEKANLTNIINIFNNYINISITYYNLDIKNHMNLIITWLTNYNDILIPLKRKIWIKYFEEKKNNNILVLKNIDIDKNLINTLNKNINKIFAFYEKTNKVLWNQLIDKNLKQDFENNKIILKDYFSAILNYEEYKNEQKLKNIWANPTPTWNWEKILKKEEAMDFLKQFQYIDYSKVKITIKDKEYCLNPNAKNDKKEVKNPNCFKVENLKVWKNWNIKINLDFLLNLNYWKQISNVVIDFTNEKYKNGIYNINDENNSKSWFLDTFNPIKKEKPPIEIIDDSENQENDSEYIRIIKNTKLINWDFKNLKDFFYIKYNNINIIEKKFNKLDINLENVEFNFKLNENREFSGIFNSKYIYWQNKHYFLNPKINFNNNFQINVYWEIKYTDFRNFFNNLLKEYKNLSSIISLLENKLTNTGNFTIEYFPKRLAIDIFSKKITLELIWEQIVSFNYNWEVQIENPITIKEFESLLEEIKKQEF